MFAVRLFFGLGRADCPNASHLFVGLLDKIFSPRVIFCPFIVEIMLGFFGLPHPDQGLVTGRKHPTGQIGGGIGFEPANVVDEMPTLLLQGKAAGINGVVGA